MLPEASAPVEEGKEALLDSPSVTTGDTAIKARGFPPICCANRFPPRPLRGASLTLRGPDSRAAARLQERRSR